ncbi:Uncharacterized conserved protein YjiS, DUF1127 family [Limimonas halophila]|uniref:Uncharacterized conserved protein YjiS, DUF1127 family n=1 Tax=Limimonas halophila TaxID=1082479 RepID=A0A1G7S9I2_9PROT|nr:DUF1127 domain-containing protein [Limimonas halophila]SDG19582.1 Uncharacterized conserved protein YjiS, DUF1127 family [Limimonas halophila]
MTAHHLPTATRPNASTGFGIRLAARVAAVLDAGARRRRIARTVRALERMDDRSLTDIGVRRQDIRSVARRVEDTGGDLHDALPPHD